MCRTREEKTNVVKRNNGNERAFDELNLEEAVTMHQNGLDFICEDGKVSMIIEHY